jgi:tetratricopeptide (TPR) repeat protein
MRDRVATYLENMPRARAVRIVCACVALTLGACAKDPRADLTLELSQDFTLGGDDRPRLEHDLTPGSWLIEVRERGMDLRVAIEVGGARTELTDHVPRHGVHARVVSVAEPARLAVELSSAEHRKMVGQGLVTISRWSHPAGNAPGDLERGFVAFGLAGEQIALNTPEGNTLAADKLHEAITHFETAGDERAEAQGHYSLANLQFRGRDEWAAAIRAAAGARETYDSTGDELGVRNAETLRAAAELELARAMNPGSQRAEQAALFEAADRRLASAAEYFTAHAQPIRAAYAVNMRGLGALFVGNYEEAGKLFIRAVEMARDNRDIGEQAKSLANLAWVHNRLGYIAQAADEYEALLPMLERDRQPTQYATVLTNYGFCLIALGEFDRALAMDTEALELFTANGRKLERATMLAALAGLHLRIGDSERALETARAAIVEQAQVGDTPGQASTLRVAGNAAAALERHDVALDYLRKSTGIDGNRNSVARTRVLIARELRNLGDLQAAEKELELAFASNNALVQAEALEERARLRLAQRNYAAAIETLRAADTRFAELGLEYSRIGTSTALSRALLAAGDVSGAAAAADEAVKIVNRIRTGSANPEWRARFLSSRYSPYEARIAADFANGADPDRSWRAFRRAEEVRARSLADELAHDDRHRKSSSDPAQEQLRAKLTAQQLRLESRMQRQDVDDADTIELRRAIEETRARIDANRASVAVNASTLPESMSQVQAKLPPDTAVLAYFVGDTGSHGWLLTRRELRHATLPGRADLERAIDGAVAAQRGGKVNSPAERSLGALLLGTLLDGSNEKRLLVIPDGRLNDVAFATLAGRGSGEMLIDRVVLGYAPSLALAMKAPQLTPTTATRVAVVSDPVYAPDDRRLAAEGTPGIFRGERPPSTTNLTRLPYSALEARAVVKAIGADDTIQLSGFEATSEQVLRLPASELAVLHFATHAVARKDAPEQSALYLSEYGPDGTLRSDARLTANDIARTGLRANVVVLSGCATGDGGKLRGEGVLGLTYGFLANGSRSVVAALWPIEDAATARFMNEFYRAYRESGRASEALRAAQLRSRGAIASAVWSSFVVRANEFP